MKKLFLIVFFSLLLLPFASAGFGYNIYPERAATTNFTLVNVNHSFSTDFWDGLDTPADISVSDLSDGADYVPYTGATTNVNLGNFNITTQDTFIGNFFRALTGNLITFYNNVLFNGNVTADYFMGDGSGLTGITVNQSLTYDIDSGKVLWMPFEAGSQTRDHSGEKNDGTVTGVIYNTTGGYDGFGAYEFDGYTDTYIYGNNRLFNPKEEFTVLAWIKNKQSGNNGAIFAQEKLVTGLAYTNFYLTNGNQLKLNSRNDSGDYFSIISGLTLQTNEWYLVGFGSNGSEILFYLNKNSTASGSNLKGSFDNLGKFLIGGRALEYIPFNGTIDEVMIFNRSLSAEEVKRLYEKRNLETSFQDDISFGGNVDILSGNLTITGDVIHEGTTNLSGDTIIEGDLDVTKNFTGNQIYAEVWYHNHTATPLTFGTDGLFYNLTLDNSDLNGFTFNDAEDSITPLVDGKYKVSWMASGDGANNEEYYTTILVNGADYDRCEAHKKMTAGGDIVTMTGNCFVDLVTTDYVQLGTANIGGTSSGNYYSATLNLVRIGD